MSSWGKPWRADSAAGARHFAAPHVHFFSSARGWDCNLCGMKVNWWTRGFCRDCGAPQQSYAAPMLEQIGYGRVTKGEPMGHSKGGGSGKGFGVKGKGAPEAGGGRNFRSAGEKGKGGQKGGKGAGLMPQQAVEILSAFVNLFADGAPDPTRVGQLREDALKALGGRAPPKLDLDAQYAKTKQEKDVLGKRCEKLHQEILQRKEQLQRMQEVYEDVKLK